MNSICIKEVCRICLKICDSNHPIENFSNPNVLPKLSFVINVEIDFSENLPDKICCDCNLRLNAAYDFKNLYCDSQIKLKEYLKCLVNIGFKNEMNASREQIELKSNLESHASDNESDSLYISEDINDSEIVSPLLLQENVAKKVKKAIRKKSFNLIKFRGKKYDCNKCDKNFTNQRVYINHLKLLHGLKKPYNCDKCNNEYASSEGLKDHISVIHEGKRLTCEVCAKEFKYPSNFLSHKKIHNDDKKHICEICKTGYVKKSELFFHFKNSHWKSGKDLSDDEVNINSIVQKYLYNCKICSIPFSTAGFKIIQKYRIIQIRHTNQEGIGPGPGSSTKTRSMLLRRHTMTLHENVRSFLCSDCGNSFSSAAGLRSHLLSHTGDKNLMCPLCGKRFTWRAGLKSHISTHTGVKPYKCSDCGLGFMSAGARREHFLRHHSRAPFACDQCPLRFARTPQLERHARVHAGEQIHRCDRCSARFSHKPSLTMHYKSMHRTELLYKCKLCTEAFMNCKSLNKHRVSNHPAERRVKVEKQSELL